MPLPGVLALAGGSLIFLALVVAFVFALAFGIYTVKGSAINKHPSDGLDGAPGSEGPSETSGKGRTSGDGSDGDTFPTHGTQ
jgi:hypothetical protein